MDGKGLENSETLVAIGRGKAELRELQLPPVPEEELPDMVRFQAGKSFATAGDNAIVDYLVTSQSESGVEIIAAALGEQELHELRDLCESNSLVSKRISIRPLAAAALYLVNQERSSGNDTVLIDLLSDEAEFVVAREGRVIFVRTVRMPADEAARGRALAGELKRSLVACGSSGTLERVVLWGLQRCTQRMSRCWWRRPTAKWRCWIRFLWLMLAAMPSRTCQITWAAGRRWLACW